VFSDMAKVLSGMSQDMPKALTVVSEDMTNNVGQELTRENLESSWDGLEHLTGA